MKTVAEFPHEVIEDADFGIPMSDGCTLSARIWIPKDAVKVPVPVILEHIPYRKRDGTIERDEFTHPWFAGHGYACIRTDMRGNGESEGLMEDEYTSRELRDAVEVILWAAMQPWSNGNVGMMGISWGGFNGLQVAALKPPPLKAVISLCSTVDRYADDIHYKGGCHLGENFGWAVNMASYSSRPPDPELVGENWKDLWLYRLENQPFHLSEWLKHQHRDDYWKHGSICQNYEALEAATLTIGGWHDGYRNTPSHVVENLKAPAKAIVGPWIHKYPHYAGPQPAIGFLQEAKRWWDKWLKGEDTGVENDPAYRAYLMDSVEPKRWLPERPGRWIAEKEWPSPNIADETWHFGESGVLWENAGNISATVSSAQDCGTQAGEYFPFAFSDELPDEQTPDDEKSLCFDSEALAESRDIVGAPRIKLWLASNKPVGQIAVRLCDLRPDGSSAFITYGVFNLPHHASHEQPSPLNPGQPVKVEFALDQIAYRLPESHCLRVAISTAYWPVIWPLGEAFELTLHSGSIALPIRPTAEGSEWSFEEPEGAEPWRHEKLRPASYTRTTNTDAESGIVTTAVDCDFGENRDLAHGLISGSSMKERWTIHPDDPLSAKVQTEWEQTGGRGGTMWRTHVLAEMSADAENYDFRALLTAFEGEDTVHQKMYQDSIPRQ